jgi:hypothetical protein
MENTKILSYILPREFVDHFDLVEIKSTDEKLDFYLDEKHVLPPEHHDKNLESKGFTKAIQLYDFPIRENKVSLHVRRRKWRDKHTGKIYTRQWDLKASGTSYTKEFAAFLKEMFR